MEEKLPSQEKDSEKIPLERWKQLNDEEKKAADILVKEGLLKGIEEEEEEEEDREEAENSSENNSSDEELPERPTFNKHTSVKHWENKAENRYEFTRDSVADMIENGASDEEIWEAAQEAGVFFKYDGSSYYLSDDSADDPTKHRWRRRSANDNTSGGYPQRKMFDHIKRELGKYRELEDAYGDFSEVFAAADILHSAGEKPTLNKMLSMSAYWEDIKSATSEAASKAQEESKAPEEHPTEAEEPATADEIPSESAAETADAEDSTEPESTEEAEGAEETTKPESDQEEKEEADIPEGTPVYLLGEAGEHGKGPRRWEEPKPLKSIHKVDGDPYVKVEGSDELYKLEKIERADTEEAYSINQEVVEDFEDQFNISAEELSEVPGFTDLTEGQQKLALKNFRQLTFSRIQEEGLKRHREYKKDSNAVYQMWQSVASTYYKGSHISEAGRELLSGGIDMHREALEDVVLHTKESGLDLDEDGELLFVRADDIDEELSPEEIETVERFNEVAQDFAQTAVQWKYEGGWSFLTGSDREAYQEKLQEYQDAHNDYVTLLADHKGGDGYREAAEADKRVRFAQFFASDGKYEKALQNIKDDAAFKQIAGETILERGGYMAMGMATRTSAVWTLSSLAAAPMIAATTVGGAAAGAGIGAYHGRRKAIDTLEDDAKLGGDGSEKEGRDLLDTVSAEALSDKLRRLMNKLDNGDLSQEEREDTAAMLKRRIRYTKQKIDGGFRTYEDENGNKHDIYLPSGLVDYGDADGRAGRKYRLLQTLKEAEAKNVINDKEHQEYTEEINNRIDRWLAISDEETREYVKERTKRGAMLVGAFGGVFGALAGWSIFGGDEAGPEADEIDYSGDKDTIDSDSPQIKPDQPEEVPTPPEQLGSQEFMIDESGEGMIHAIADKLEAEYEISHEKAMEIGNKLFIKGEQLKGDDEMFNLVGKGDSFSVDFGELTPEDLQDKPAGELVETIDFDQDNFTSGSDVTPAEELPETSDTDTEGYKDIPFDRIDEVDVPSADTSGAIYGGHNPVKSVDDVDVPDAGNLSEQDVENWEQELEEEGIIVKDTPDADTPADGEPTNLEVEPAADNVEKVPGSVTPEQVNQLPSSELASYAHHAWTYASEGHNYMDVPAENLQYLQQLLRQDMSATATENILKLKSNPELLTSLERVLTGATESGLERYTEEAEDVLTFVREHVSQLDADDFDGDIPEYAQQSIEDSKNTVNQLPKAA